MENTSHVGRPANESARYTSVRNELLEAEFTLKEQRKKVAELRRQLPQDLVVENYSFQEGDPAREVRLSELFLTPDRPLVIYHFMYGGAQKNPCPMCSMWLDGWNGAARHLRQCVNFAIVAQAPIADFRNWGQTRGWAGLRLLSSANNSFKHDFQTQDTDGNQFPAVSVFSRSGDGSIRHFYSASAMMGGNTFGGMDFLTPVWNVLDLTPEGRADWMPSLEYKD